MDYNVGDILMRRMVNGTVIIRRVCSVSEDIVSFDTPVYNSSYFATTEATLTLGLVRNHYKHVTLWDRRRYGI